MHLRTCLLPVLLLFVLACQKAETPELLSPMAELHLEAHHPAFHFTPPGEWMNDPNGMFFLDGAYHLFYQYHPASNVWGPMHWGHAVSTDLVHWEQLPVALYPDALGTIFSGSAVVDTKNTSGFRAGDTPPVIAIFTQHDTEGEKAGVDTFQTQGIAYSNDKGRTWTKYTGNPVLSNPGIRDFRDPKVFWHEESSQWVMILAVKDRVHLYRSLDLKSWTFSSAFGVDLGAHGGVWECPDLFPLTIEGTDQQKWVMLVSINPGGPNGGSATQFFVGEFDGQNFAIDPGFLEQIQSDTTFQTAAWIDYGRDNYAGVTWSNVPDDDGRRLFIGWMSNWDYAQVVPTEAWRSAMTVARSLHLINNESGWHLASRPVNELTKIRKPAGAYQLPRTKTDNDLDLTSKIDTSVAKELLLEVELGEEKEGNFGIELANAAGQRYRLGYDAGRNQFYSDRRESGNHDFSEKFANAVHWADRNSDDPVLKLHLYVDRASVEAFADNGLTVITDIFFPTEDFRQLHFFVESGDIQISKLEVYGLETIWK